MYHDVLLYYRHRTKTRWKEGKYDIEERKQGRREGETGDGVLGAADV
jgi:hypothetical protein